MFMGTERVPEKMFDAWMEQEGGSNNAWTSNDRTVYHDVGPTHALPLLLWMEADRVSTLGRQITLAKLDAQRDVVKNERARPAKTSLTARPSSCCRSSCSPRDTRTTTP
jgi:predicted Zn-dependent peptidase